MAATEGAHPCKIFIGGLSLSTTEHSLSQFYSKWGTVVACNIPMDPLRNQSKCFGFVTFERPASADVCLSNLPHFLDGRNVDAKRFFIRSPTITGNHSAAYLRSYDQFKKYPIYGDTDEMTLRVNWTHNCSKGALREMFSAFGAIVEITTWTLTGRSGMFADIRFESAISKPKAFAAICKGEMPEFNLASASVGRRPSVAAKKAATVLETVAKEDSGGDNLSLKTSFSGDSGSNARFNAESSSLALPRGPAASPEAYGMQLGGVTGPETKPEGKAQKRISAGLLVVLADAGVKHQVNLRLKEQDMYCGWRVSSDISCLVVRSLPRSPLDASRCSEIADFIVSFVSTASIFIGLKRKAAGESPEFARRTKAWMAEAKGAIQIVTALNNVYVVGKQDEAKAWLKKIRDYLDNFVVPDVSAPKLSEATRLPAEDKSPASLNNSEPAQEQAAPAKPSPDLIAGKVSNIQASHIRESILDRIRSRPQSNAVDRFSSSPSLHGAPIPQSSAGGEASLQTNHIPRIPDEIFPRPHTEIPESAGAKPAPSENPRLSEDAVGKPMTAFASAMHKAAANGLIGAPSVAPSALPRTLPLRKKAHVHKHMVDEENRPFLALLDVETVKTRINRHLQTKGHACKWSSAIASISVEFAEPPASIEEKAAAVCSAIWACLAKYTLDVPNFAKLPDSVVGEFRKKVAKLWFVDKTTTAVLSNDKSKVTIYSADGDTEAWRGWILRFFEARLKSSIAQINFAESSAVLCKYGNPQVLLKLLSRRYRVLKTLLQKNGSLEISGLADELIKAEQWLKDKATVLGRQGYVVSHPFFAYLLSQPSYAGLLAKVEENCDCLILPLNECLDVAPQRVGEKSIKLPHGQELKFVEMRGDIHQQKVDVILKLIKTEAEFEALQLHKTDNSGQSITASLSSGNSLWIRDFADTTTADDLKMLLAPYGNVTAVKIITSGKSRFGFVTMSSREEATKCMAALYSGSLAGKSISAKRSSTDSFPFSAALPSASASSLLVNSNGQSSGPSSQRSLPHLILSSDPGLLYGNHVLYAHCPDLLSSAPELPGSSSFASNFFAACKLSSASPAKLQCFFADCFTLLESLGVRSLAIPVGGANESAGFPYAAVQQALPSALNSCSHSSTKVDLTEIRLVLPSPSASDATSSASKRTSGSIPTATPKITTVSSGSADAAAAGSVRKVKLRMPVMDVSGFSAMPSLSASQNVVSLSNGVTVRLLQDDIAQNDAQVLVSSTSEGKRNLADGGAACKAIFAAGGAALKDHVTKICPTGLLPNQDCKLMWAQCGTLKCQCVVHVCLPTFSGDTAQGRDVIKRKIFACLNAASGHASIAFPVIGAGGLGYPADVVARGLLAAVSIFSLQQSHSLKDIRFIVHSADHNGMLDVAAVFRSYSTFSNAQPVSLANNSAQGPAANTLPKPASDPSGKPGDKVQAVSIGALTVSFEPPLRKEHILLISTENLQFATEWLDVVARGLKQADELKLSSLVIAMVANSSSGLRLSPAYFADLFFAASLVFEAKQPRHLKLLRPHFENVSLLQEFSSRFTELATLADHNSSVAAAASHISSPHSRALMLVALSTGPMLISFEKKLKDSGLFSDNPPQLANKSCADYGCVQPPADFVIFGGPSSIADACKLLDGLQQSAFALFDQKSNNSSLDWYENIPKDYSDVVAVSGSEFRIVGKPNLSTTEELMIKVSDALDKLVTPPRLLSNVPKTSDWYAKGVDGVWHAFGKRDAVFLEYLFGRVQKQNSHGIVTIDFASLKVVVGKHSLDLLRQTDHHVPMHWISAADDVVHRKVDLQPNSPEYMDILAIVEQTNSRQSKVLKIQRIENRPLYQQYLIQKGKVTRNCPKHLTVERDLFHGTSNEHLAGICEDGFDRSRAGTSGGKRFGAGSYFSTRFDYSSDSRYAKDGYILYCKVLVGESTPGHPELKILPQKPSGAKYDSAVDSLIDPSIFVVFSDNHAFPAYLITLAQDVPNFFYY